MVKRRLFLPASIGCVLMLLLLNTVMAQAQDLTPSPPPAITTPTNGSANDLTPQINLAQLERLLAETEKNAADAARYAGDASRFLGLFEAFSVVIAVSAGTLSVIGISRLFSAQSSLNETRKKLFEELEQLRKDFDVQIDARENDLKQLETQLLKTVEEQRKTASQSTLALSLLPLGERQYRAQDYNGAADTYRRALALDENNPLICYRLGYVCVQNAQFHEAEQNLLRALAIDPDFVLARAALGFVYRRIAEKLPESVERDLMMNKGEQYLLNALKAQPRLVDEDSESWWGSLGGLYRRRGQVAQAIHAYEEAAKVTPHSSYPFSNLALLYMEKNDKDRMMQTYVRVERLARGEAHAEVDNYWAYADLLTASLALGKTAEADGALISVLDIAPSDSENYALKSLIDTLVRLRGAMGDDDNASPIETYVNRIKARIQQRETALPPVVPAT